MGPSVSPILTLLPWRTGSNHCSIFYVCWVEVVVKCLFGRTVISTVHSEKAGFNGRVMRVVYVSFLRKVMIRHFGKCKSAINHLHQLQTFGIFFMEIQPLLLSNPCPRPYFKQGQKLLVLQRQLPGVPKSSEKRKLAIPWGCGWLFVKSGNLPQTSNYESQFAKGTQTPSIVWFLMLLARCWRMLCFGKPRWQWKSRMLCSRWGSVVVLAYWRAFDIPKAEVLVLWSLSRRLQQDLYGTRRETVV